MFCRLLSFQPYKVAADKSKDNSTGTGNKTESNTLEMNGAKSDEVITVTDLYKAESGPLRTLFGEIGKTKDTLYTVQDIKESLKEYIQAKDLSVPNNPR